MRPIPLELSSLGRDVLGLIFDFLPRKYLIQFALVSRQLRANLQKPTFGKKWRNVSWRGVPPPWLEKKYMNIVIRGDSGDVSIFDSIFKLDLSHCSTLNDVSALGAVHTLDLSRCTGINDVSALGNVHTLNLSRCSRITDVSALGNVHTLNLSECTEIKDVSALGNVHTLDISWCSGIKDMSALTNVHTLRL